MFQLVTPWTPGFRLGQPVAAAPAVTPGVPAAPAAAPSSSGKGALVGGLAGAAIALGIGAVGVLFSYGVAAESKSGLVKTTGYILAGAGALAALINAGAVFVAVTKA